MDELLRYYYDNYRLHKKQLKQHEDENLLYKNASGFEKALMLLYMFPVLTSLYKFTFCR